ncbi:hypothetical protein ACLKA7_010970 [Drosophila subpalustris]
MRKQRTRRAKKLHGNCTEDAAKDEDEDKAVNETQPRITITMRHKVTRRQHLVEADAVGDGDGYGYGDSTRNQTPRRDELLQQPSLGNSNSHATR